MQTSSIISSAITRLTYLCETIPALLRVIDDHSFSEKTGGKWSKKEILGHLIDSATNNHQRFVRGQFEQIPKITYNQDQWNACNFYQEISPGQIIDFWTVYNRQLLELIKNIPAERLEHKINTGGREDLSIGFLIGDYVEHLEHHLRQVVAY